MTFLSFFFLIFYFFFLDGYVKVSFFIVIFFLIVFLYHYFIHHHHHCHYYPILYHHHIFRCHYHISFITITFLGVSRHSSSFIIFLLPSLSSLLLSYFIFLFLLCLQFV